MKLMHPRPPPIYIDDDYIVERRAKQKLFDDLDKAIFTMLFRKKDMSDVKDTLNDRKATHGNFIDHAYITQELKRCLNIGDRYNSLRDTQKEALEMIAHKIGRILAGNPDHIDHWHDIAGYATLVEQELIIIKKGNTEFRCWTEVSNENAIKQPVKENTTQTEIAKLFAGFEKAVYQLISQSQNGN